MSYNNIKIQEFEDCELSLKAFFATTSINQSISIGGCRVMNYLTSEEALNDAVNLARNMALKYRVVDLPYEGFKAVVHSLDNSRRSQCFERIGDWVESYNGRCYIATDVGSSLDDMCAIRKNTEYVIDLPEQEGGFGSFIPLLTEGVINGLRASLRYKYGTESFEGLSAYVLGFGKSGMAIAKRLKELGCEVSGFDVDTQRNLEAQKEGIFIVKDFTKGRYNLFVPCSVGNVLNETNSNQVNFDIVGGSANHPVNEMADKVLHSKGIIVIPDFVISSGTIVLDDLLVNGEKATLEEGLRRTNKIYGFVNSIFQNQSNGKTMREIALGLLGY
ncbi:MAG: hypothetical protein ACTSX6_10180 [Candidatus Heimdallarchaeaceae archaeon]